MKWRKDELGARFRRHTGFSRTTPRKLFQAFGKPVSRAIVAAGEKVGSRKSLLAAVGGIVAVTLVLTEQITWSGPAQEPKSLLAQTRTAATVIAQAPQEARLAFETASIRPTNRNAPAPDGARGGGGGGAGPEGCGNGVIQVDPGRFVMTGMTLQGLIAWAYPEWIEARGGCVLAGSANLLSGGPSWVKSDQYDVQATMPKGTPPYNTRLFTEHKTPEIDRMLQTLLAERFKLVIGHQTKEVPVFFLKVAKGGPKFNGARPQATGPDGRPQIFLIQDANGNPVQSNEPGQGTMVLPQRDQNGDVHAALSATRITMSEWAKFLNVSAGRLVLDRTGLTGQYTFHLDYDNKGVTAPRLINVLDEVGLELEAGKAPGEVWTIERAERPSEN
jgi:uncharacterized protein (TIGR03435 family)